MAYPTAPTDPIITIASDTTYSAPGEDWDGADTKVAPTVAIETQGYVPNDPRPADVDNYMFDNLAQWSTFFKNALAALFNGSTFTYPGTVTRTRRWSFGHFELPGASTAVRTTAGNGPLCILTTDRGSAFREVIIPHGATITTISVRVTPGIGRTLTDRMYFQAFEMTADSTGTDFTALASTQYQANTAVAQTLTATGLSKVVDATKPITINVTGGNDAGTNNDRIHWVDVTWTEPGPSY